MRIPWLIKTRKGVALGNRAPPINFLKRWFLDFFDEYYSSEPQTDSTWSSSARDEKATVWTPLASPKRRRTDNYTRMTASTRQAECYSFQIHTKGEPDPLSNRQTYLKNVICVWYQQTWKSVLGRRAITQTKVKQVTTSKALRKRKVANASEDKNYRETDSLLVTA